MKLNGFSFLLGMVSMLVILAFGNYLIDDDVKTSMILEKAFSKGYEMQTAMLVNRTKIQGLLREKDDLTKDDVEYVRQLWERDHSLMLGKLAHYIKVNEELPPVFRVNDGASRDAIKEWADTVSGSNKMIMDKDK